MLGGCSTTNWQKEIMTGYPLYYGVSITDANRVWVVGSKGMLLGYDGSAWRSFDSGTEEDLLSVSSRGPEHAWAVGRKGTIRFFNGSEWVSQDGGTTRTLFSVFALDQAHVWAVGDGVALFFDGNRWTRWDVPWVMRSVTAAPGRVWAAGNEGIYALDGNAWSLQYKSPLPLVGVSACDSTHAWAVGRPLVQQLPVSTVFFCNGSTWAEQRKVPDHNLYAIFARSPREVWVAGESGKALFFDGADWGYRDLSQYVSTSGIASNGVNVWAVGIRLGPRNASVGAVFRFENGRWVEEAPSL
jgi:hypothetical protein